MTTIENDPVLAREYLTTLQQIDLLLNNKPEFDYGQGLLERVRRRSTSQGGGSSVNEPKPASYYCNPVTAAAGNSAIGQLADNSVHMQPAPTNGQHQSSIATNKQPLPPFPGRAGDGGRSTKSSDTGAVEDQAAGDTHSICDIAITIKPTPTPLTPKSHSTRASSNSSSNSSHSVPQPSHKANPAVAASSPSCSHVSTAGSFESVTAGRQASSSASITEESSHASSPEDPEVPSASHPCQANMAPSRHTHPSNSSEDEGNVSASQKLSNGGQGGKGGRQESSPDLMAPQLRDHTQESDQTARPVAVAAGSESSEGSVMGPDDAVARAVRLRDSPATPKHRRHGNSTQHGSQGTPHSGDHHAASVGSSSAESSDIVSQANRLRNTPPTPPNQRLRQLDALALHPARVLPPASSHELSSEEEDIVDQANRLRNHGSTRAPRRLAPMEGVAGPAADGAKLSVHLHPETQAPPKSMRSTAASKNFASSGSDSSDAERASCASRSSSLSTKKRPAPARVRRRGYAVYRVADMLPLEVHAVRGGGQLDAPVDDVDRRSVCRDTRVGTESAAFGSAISGLADTGVQPVPTVSVVPRLDLGQRLPPVHDGHGSPNLGGNHQTGPWQDGDITFNALTDTLPHSYVRQGLGHSVCGSPPPTMQPVLKQRGVMRALQGGRAGAGVGGLLNADPYQWMMRADQIFKPLAALPSTSEEDSEEEVRHRRKPGRTQTRQGVSQRVEAAGDNVNKGAAAGAHGAGSVARASPTRQQHALLAPAQNTKPSEVLPQQPPPSHDARHRHNIGCSSPVVDSQHQQKQLHQTSTWHAQVPPALPGTFPVATTTILTLAMPTPTPPSISVAPMVAPVGASQQPAHQTQDSTAINGTQAQPLQPEQQELLQPLQSQQQQQQRAVGGVWQADPLALSSATPPPLQPATQPGRGDQGLTELVSQLSQLVQVLSRQQQQQQTGALAIVGAEDAPRSTMQAQAEPQGATQPREQDREPAAYVGPGLGLPPRLPLYTIPRHVQSSGPSTDRSSTEYYPSPRDHHTDRQAGAPQAATVQFEGSVGAAATLPPSARAKAVPPTMPAPAPSKPQPPPTLIPVSATAHPGGEPRGVEKHKQPSSEAAPDAQRSDYMMHNDVQHPPVGPSRPAPYQSQLTLHSPFVQHYMPQASQEEEPAATMQPKAPHTVPHRMLYNQQERQQSAYWEHEHEYEHHEPLAEHYASQGVIQPQQQEAGHWHEQEVGHAAGEDPHNLQSPGHSTYSVSASERAPPQAARSLYTSHPTHTASQPPPHVPYAHMHTQSASVHAAQYGQFQSPHPRMPHAQPHQLHQASPQACPPSHGMQQGVQGLPIATHTSPRFGGDTSMYATWGKHTAQPPPPISGLTHPAPVIPLATSPGHSTAPYTVPMSPPPPPRPPHQPTLPVQWVQSPQPTYLTATANTMPSTPSTAHTFSAAAAKVRVMSEPAQGAVRQSEAYTVLQLPNAPGSSWSVKMEGGTLHVMQQAPKGITKKASHTNSLPEAEGGPPQAFNPQLFPWAADSSQQPQYPPPSTQGSTWVDVSGYDNMPMLGSQPVSLGYTQTIPAALRAFTHLATPGYSYMPAPVHPAAALMPMAAAGHVPAAGSSLHPFFHELMSAANSLHAAASLAATQLGGVPTVRDPSVMGRGVKVSGVEARGEEPWRRSAVPVNFPQAVVEELDLSHGRASLMRSV